MTNDGMKKVLWLLALWGLLALPCANAQPRRLEPSFWKQRLFFIPYQVTGTGKLLEPIDKVQLLASRTGANDWAKLEEAETNVRGFSYHAPEDGEYWFALRHLDRQGRPWPNAEVQPQIRIIVDTQQPTLTISGSTDASGELVLRYEARDANLQAESLVLEVRGVADNWSPLGAGTPDISQPDRLVGRVRWRPPARAESIDVRGVIADRAGHRAVAEAKVALRGTQDPSAVSHDFLQGPALRNPFLRSSTNAAREKSETPKLPSAIKNPFASISQLPSQDWPANNRLPQKSSADSASPRPTPPQSNPYTLGDRTQPSRTQARLVGDEAQSLDVTPLGPDNAPSLGNGTPGAAAARPQRTAPSQWKPAVTPSNQATRVVNSRTFDVEYDLQSVGPWGVAKVELWGTHDGGQTWRSFGVDPDNRSPIRVTVPAAGTFGFRILVDGANSAGSAPPQSGDAPELSVAVDLQPPSAELLAADLGQGNLADHLMVRWTAEDTNLEPRPIALFYSSYPNGPWSMIASGLENTGSYTWRIERHVPGRFYLRLEARDTAGNISTYQSPTPIALARPQPTGSLRGVRPIGN